MVYKLGMAIKKEFLLLIRDMGGIIILFVMPLVLLITITMVQKGTYDSIIGAKIDVLLVDNDKGEIANTIKSQFNAVGSFNLISALKGQAISEDFAQTAVFKGDYQLAIVLPPDMSRDMQRQVKQNVGKILSQFDYSSTDTVPEASPVKTKEIKLYFDPATQSAFKTAIKSSIDKLVSTMETEKIYAAFQAELGETDTASSMFPQEKFISFREIMQKKEGADIVPNAVQHNVPAWALFAIFFIIVPLSINIVKEKSQGTMVRLITNPVPYSFFLLGKTITYLLISIIQFYLMLLFGVFIFPLFGLPMFDVGNSFGLLTLVAFFSGLAAIGLGILLGTLATTQEQSAPFGATFVVVLAALGGVWVPVFVMPAVMQKLAVLSPMNWGLNAFYDVVLRNAGLSDIAAELNFLLLFFIITLGIAIVYEKKKRSI